MEEQFYEDIINFEKKLLDFIDRKTNDDESLFDCVEYFCKFKNEPLNFQEYFEKTIIGKVHRKNYDYFSFNYDEKLRKYFSLSCIKYIWFKDGILCLKTYNDIKIRIKKTNENYLKESLTDVASAIISKIYNKI